MSLTPATWVRAVPSRSSPAAVGRRGHGPAVPAPLVVRFAGRRPPQPCGARRPQHRVASVDTAGALAGVLDPQATRTRMRDHLALTAVAKIMADAGTDVIVHARRGEITEAINTVHRNRTVLPAGQAAGLDVRRSGAEALTRPAMTAAGGLEPVVGFPPPTWHLAALSNRPSSPLRGRLSALRCTAPGGTSQRSWGSQFDDRLSRRPCGAGRACPGRVPGGRRAGWSRRPRSPGHGRGSSPEAGMPRSRSAVALPGRRTATSNR